MKDQEEPRVMTRYFVKELKEGLTFIEIEKDRKQASFGERVESRIHF